MARAHLKVFNLSAFDPLKVFCYTSNAVSHTHKQLIALALALIVSLAAAKAQTRTTRRATESNTQQLPFANARNVSVVIFKASLRSGASPIGSGVWIGKQGYIVTCQHVIAGVSAGEIKIGIVYDPYVTAGSPNVSITASGNLFSVDLVDSDPDADIAILKARTTPDNVRIAPLISGNVPASITPQPPITPKGAVLNTEFPKAGQTLLLAGFPLGENTLILQTGTMTGFRTNPSKTPTGLLSSGLRLVLSLVSNPGNSGGPVLDADGKVVGLLEGNLLSVVQNNDLGIELCAWARTGDDGQPIRDATGQPQIQTAPCQQNSGISFAVPAKLVAEFAKKKNVNFD